MEESTADWLPSATEGKGRGYGNILPRLPYISSVNNWASGDSPLAQLVKELDLCLYLCVIQSLWDRLGAEPINNFSPPTTVW